MCRLAGRHPASADTRQGIALTVTLPEEKNFQILPPFGHVDMSKRTRKRIEQINETCTALRRV